MKKLIATTLVGIVAGVVAYAQGTVTFANAGVGLNAPVHMSDGTTKVAGPNFVAILLGGASQASMTQIGGPVALLSGGSAGYFNGGAATVTGVAAGSTGFFEVIVWDTTLGGTTTGASMAAAESYWQAGHADVFGASGMNYNTGVETAFQNTTGNVGSPPTPPATLTGLSSFSLAPVIPEPSTFALVGLGAAASLIFRRRK